MISSVLGILSKVILLFLRAQSMNSFPPPLDRETEKKLFELAKEGDSSARAKLIEHNLRLVAHIVKKYYSSFKDQEDLISVGTIGLIKAIDSFNIENGARFATYAGKCLQNEILMYFRLQKKQNMENSIEDAVDTDKDGNPLTYLDILYKDDTILDEIDLKMKSAKIYESLREVLDERERTVIILRYGLGGGKAYPQREVAERLNISRSYVSRIEKNALEKLKENL
ncbi:MAG: RNA polymerase sporulation sigma factor SigK [Clostridia bacterium]